ncbi:MAG: hypothetical protein VX642_13840 [Bdellovibrionota bacterium]|nr:hypothetical protein [Bdellovibrionota bacterium]
MGKKSFYKLFVRKIASDDSGEIIVLLLVISGMLAFTMSTLSIYSVNQANYLNRVREAYQMMSVTEALAKSFGQSKEMANSALEQMYKQEGDDVDGSTLSKSEVEAYIASRSLAVTADTIPCDDTGRLIRWAGSDPAMGGAAFCGTEAEYCMKRPDSNEEICAATVVQINPSKIQFHMNELNPQGPLEKFGTMIARNFSFGKSSARKSSRDLILNNGSGLEMIASSIGSKIEDLDLFNNFAVAADNTSSVGQAITLADPLLTVTDSSGNQYSVVDLYSNHTYSVRKNIIDNLSPDQKLKLTNYVEDSIQRISTIDTSTGNYLDVDDAKELYDVLKVIEGTQMGYEIMGSHSGNADGMENGSSNRNLWRYRELVRHYHNTVKNMSDPSTLVSYAVSQCVGRNCPDSLGALDMLVTKKAMSSWASTDSDWGNKLSTNINAYSGSLSSVVVATSAGYDPLDFATSMALTPEADFNAAVIGPDHRKEGARIAKSCAELNRCLSIEAVTSSDSSGNSVVGRTFGQNVFVQ